MKDSALNHSIVSESSVRDYISLLKPRVMSLVVFTAIAGLFLAPGKIHPFIAFVSILCTALGSGAAGCLNMWYDRDIDSIMERTKKRPIVTGVIEESEALAFGIFLSIISIIGMMVCVNIISGIILAISIGFYFFIYTVWLKRSSVQNIVIGGAAGSFPPIIGWSSVTGTIDVDAIILFLIIFLWTPPHFWALALYKSEDYKRAKIPMMPVIHGADYTKKQIVIYSILMAASTFLPFFTGLVGYSYLIICVVLNIYFVYLAVRLLVSEKILESRLLKIAPRLFGYSILYLFAIFTALVASNSLGL
jgi:protoheme IX farnesyltransferase